LVPAEHPLVALGRCGAARSTSIAYRAIALISLSLGFVIGNDDRDAPLMKRQRFDGGASGRQAGRRRVHDLNS
jgi:hypothetical protein